jgi:DNA-binding CsgD family transcriptional regulator
MLARRVQDVIGRIPHLHPYFGHHVRVPAEGVTTHRVAGEEALARCEWTNAEREFARVLAQSPTDPWALDGLCLALFWLGDGKGCRKARERSYVEHRRLGNSHDAAAAALFVASDYRVSDANQAAWAGWLARAERCLDGVGSCPERGTVEVERAKCAPDPETREAHARKALEIATELEDPDLEINALGQVGIALVDSGRWEEGMAALDEGMAAALGGEAKDTRAIGDICCQTLLACDQIADLKRASEWCRVVIRYTEERNFTPLYAWCRAIYAGVLIATGDWERAERELFESLRRYDEGASVGSRVMTLARLADLRLRQGQLEAAERFLAGHEEHPLATLPVAQLRLLRGETSVGREILERAVSRLRSGSAAEAQFLRPLVQVRLATQDGVGAADAAERLVSIARELRRDNLLALGELSRGEVALDEGGAIPHLEVAVELFLELRMPYEEGIARAGLARALSADSPELARGQASAALAIFERLDATLAADEAAGLLRSLGGGGRTRTTGNGELTRREEEVLALLAEGLSNAQIAQRLVIAEKTAGHHVSHILTKLGARNRTEAAADAVRRGAPG